MQYKKSGFRLPNKFARLYLEAVEEVLGKEGLAQLLEQAGLKLLINNFPPGNLEKSFDFVYFTAIQEAFEQFQDGAELARQTGRAAFRLGLPQFGELAGVNTPEFKALPMDQKLRVGLPALARIITQFSDQISSAYRFNEQTYIYTLERCPMCWNRESDHPLCYTGQGLIQEALHWASGGQAFRVEMSACVAQGDEMGRYVIYKDPIA